MIDKKSQRHIRRKFFPVIPSSPEGSQEKCLESKTDQVTEYQRKSIWKTWAGVERKCFCFPTSESLFLLYALVKVFVFVFCLLYFCFCFSISTMKASAHMWYSKSSIFWPHVKIFYKESIIPLAAGNPRCGEAASNPNDLLSKNCHCFIFYLINFKFSNSI